MAYRKQKKTPLHLLVQDQNFNSVSVLMSLQHLSDWKPLSHRIVQLVICAAETREQMKHVALCCPFWSLMGVNWSETKCLYSLKNTCGPFELSHAT